MGSARLIPCCRFHFRSLAFSNSSLAMKATTNSKERMILRMISSNFSKMKDTKNMLGSKKLKYTIENHFYLNQSSNLQQRGASFLEDHRYKNLNLTDYKIISNKNKLSASNQISGKNFYNYFESSQSHKSLAFQQFFPRLSLGKWKLAFVNLPSSVLYGSTLTASAYHTSSKVQSVNPSSDINSDAKNKKLGATKKTSSPSSDTIIEEKSKELYSSTGSTGRSTFQPIPSGITETAGSMLEPDLWDALEKGQLGKLLPRRQIPKDVLTIETVAYWNSTSQVPIFGNVFGKNRPGQNNNVQVSPDQYKITLRVNISDLQLDPKSEARLRCLVGPRFNHKTNEIVLKSQRFLNRIHNMQYLVYLLENLVTEAKGENEGQVSVDEDMKEYNLHTGEQTKKDK